MSSTPKWVAPVMLMIAALSLVPFAVIARVRTTKSEKPRIHLNPNMDNQVRYANQLANPWFADGRAMRPPVEGTVARGGLELDTHYFRGTVGEAYAEDFPEQVEVGHALMDRGRERYGIYCAPCHGLSGYGDGIVARRADALQQGLWIPPASFHAEPAYGRPVGHIFNTITNGIRTMPAYASQIPVEDRWAIVAYVRALQRSQHASLEDVPEDKRSQLR
jgi:mono/diheme cytochrome c family protein